MFDAQNDPLGIAVQTRGRDKRLAYQNGEGFGHLSGVLPDPKWDGFFEAMDEGNVSGMADSSVGVKKGMFSPTAPMGGTYDPKYQASSVDAMGPSHQIGEPGMNIPASVRALLKGVR